ncbi:LuxR C-terminal-related transcriptional regulator [Microbacterium sp. NPDC090007]|uniref:LuxR C-terminal-related transcriptional regulator n=1 Tax=Microbacterium sp. NPDC090007 TaxID=3364204 RepID=UPI00380671D3
MGNEKPTASSANTVGADRDAVALAQRVLRGASLLIAGPRGSGRSNLLRAITAEIQGTGARTAVVRPCSALSGVPFGALEASRGPCDDDVRAIIAEDAIDTVIVVDDVDALDANSMRALERAVASGRATVVFALRTARPRAVDRPDDENQVRRAVLGLWIDGILDRVDLRELSDDDALALIDVFPDADLLDRATRAALVWRADGSRALLRHLILEATAAARAGRDPLSPLRAIARDSRLAVALERHVADIARPDLECLAVVLHLPHLELAAATRLFNAESVHALLAGGLMHADSSAERRLTVNDLVAQEARRQLGAAHVDDLVQAAGARMLAEDDEWWSVPIAVALSERWHRQGTDSDESTYSPSIRARVALAAARAANDRGDSAHAAAHALRGLRAKDDADLRLEADLAARTSGEAYADDPDPAARRRRARAAAERRGSLTHASSNAEADARVEELLADSMRASAEMDWARATEAAARAAGETAASPAARLRAAVATGTAEVFRGRWKLAQHHYADAERMLNARRRTPGIHTRDRLAALMSMLAGHQIAGADGARLHQRLQDEVAMTAREGGAADLTIAGAAGAIAYAGEGRSRESARELTTALSRDPSALVGVQAAMIELGVAEELAMSGRLGEARAIITTVDDQGSVLVRRSRLFVESTVLAAEGRHDQARRSARAAAELTRISSAPALRIRDLSRLMTLNAAQQDEIDELVQLAATTDLPIAAEAVRRAAAHPGDDVDIPVDELRLHALWSTDDRRSAETAPAARIPAPGAPTSVADELTAREREIALMANEGLTNREIATRLFLSIRTVESHVYQARMKVGAASRRELGRLVAAGVGLRGEATRAAPSEEDEAWKRRGAGARVARS